MCYFSEAHHPGVLQLTGGPNQNCESVRNFLAAGSIIGFLEPVTGMLTGSSNLVPVPLTLRRICVKIYNLQKGEEIKLKFLFCIGCTLL